MNLASFSQGLIHLFYPRLCEGCRKPLHHQEDTICIGCQTNIAYTHFHHLKNNETSNRLSGRIPFLHATSLAYFADQGLLQHLIHSMKYKDKQNVGLFLGRELGKCIRQESWDIDAIIPVPLHKKKELKRGYNQSNLIAHGIGDVIQVPVISNALIRTRYTESQTEKTREQRIENVHQAFSLTSPSIVASKHLLLIDDVLTTGATVEACASTLLNASEVTVSIATVGLAG